MNNQTIEIVIADDATHENVFAEIYIDGKFVCLLSNEGCALKLEFPGPDLVEEAICRSVDIETFQGAVLLAKERLIEK